MKACAVYTTGAVEFFDLAEKDDERYRQCREVIGGYIEAVRIPNGYMLVDEDGKMKNLDGNLLATEIYQHDMIVGNVVLIGDDGSPEFVGLDDTWIEVLTPYVTR